MIRSVRDRADFDALRRDGRRSRSGPLQVRFCPGDPGAPVRVAYAIGRPVGGAVIRNRIRRRLRAAVHELDTAGQIPPGVYLVSVSPGASAQSYAELSGHLRTALSRFGATTR